MEFGIDNIVVNLAEVPNINDKSFSRWVRECVKSLPEAFKPENLRGNVPDKVLLEVRSLIILRDSVTKDQIR